MTCFKNGFSLAYLGDMFTKLSYLSKQRLRFVSYLKEARAEPSTDVYRQRNASHATTFRRAAGSKLHLDRVVTDFSVRVSRLLSLLNSRRRKIFAAVSSISQFASLPYPATFVCALFALPYIHKIVAVRGPYI